MKVITTVVGSLQTNCYLLIDEETKSAALIDPGDEAEKLLALVKSEGVTLKYILLTHGHRDHTLAVPALKKALPDVPVYIGEADAHSTGIYHYPMADLVPDLKYYGEGDTLPLGSLTIKVLATPGHTLGGVTLLVGDAMFPGDTLFAGSMGRTDLPGGNDAQMLASLMLLITSALPNVAGVGPMEFAFLLLFAPWADTAIASSALVLYRVATYFFPFLLSVVVFLHEEKKSLKGFDAQSA